MTIQDDKRENELIEIFGLKKPKNSGRSGTDAILKIDGETFHFELKSTTTGSVTTVRDFGPDHIKKWKGKHWIIGVYEPSTQKLLFCYYGSPAAVAPWISEKEEYVRVDFELSKLVPDLITLPIMHRILGNKAKYSIEDAMKLQKKQYSISDYRRLMDVPSGYSPERMLQILKDRCKYLIDRGSTLNNPHIPASYFVGWEKIKNNHAKRLRELLKSASHR
jgi:hypothetical protein